MRCLENKKLKMNIEGRENNMEKSNQPDGGYRKNFGIMIPQTALYQLRGYYITGATQEEFDRFESWFEQQRYEQLQLRGISIDMWIRWNDIVVDHIGYSIQHLFENWKENPPSKGGYEWTTHTFKK